MAVNEISRQPPRNYLLVPPLCSINCGDTAEHSFSPLESERGGRRNSKAPSLLPPSPPTRSCLVLVTHCSTHSFLSRVRALERHDHFAVTTPPLPAPYPPPPSPLLRAAAGAPSPASSSDTINAMAAVVAASADAPADDVGRDGGGDTASGSASPGTPNSETTAAQAKVFHRLCFAPVSGGSEAETGDAGGGGGNGGGEMTVVPSSAEPLLSFQQVGKNKNKKRNEPERVGQFR